MCIAARGACQVMRNVTAKDMIALRAASDQIEAKMREMMPIRVVSGDRGFGYYSESQRARAEDHAARLIFAGVYARVIDTRVEAWPS